MLNNIVSIYEIIVCCLRCASCCCGQ